MSDAAPPASSLHPSTAAALPIDHRLAIALIEPKIAPNTGNIGRLCVTTGTALHLVRPLGFQLDDRNVRRSAMDYWPRLKLTVHDDLGGFLKTIGIERCWFFSTKATRSFWDVPIARNDVLVFGSETHGLPEWLLEQHAPRAVQIPQVPGERCLNLATAAGIGLYEALRKLRA